MGKLEDKVAIVTGASSGFGEATAYLWAQEGAKVVIADVLVEAGERVAKAIEDGGGAAIFVKTDVTKEGDAENMVKQAVGVYGKLDILFNNAGILGPTAKLQEVTEEDIDRLLAVNLKGAVLGTKHAVPAMIASGGGAILSTGSDSAFRGNRNVGCVLRHEGRDCSVYPRYRHGLRRQWHTLQLRQSVHRRDTDAREVAGAGR